MAKSMFFQNINEAQPDPVFGLQEAFKADVRPQKVDLMVGIYKDDHLKTELLPSVRKSKEQIFNQDLMADYLPMDGWAELIQLLGPIVFGEESWKENHGRIYGAHTVGGTGALRIGADFLAQEVTKKVSIPNHTWPNHRAIFERAGFQIENYPYYNREKKDFDLDAMIAFLEKAPEGMAVILHACCHNPTGCDPKLQDWKEISLVMKERKLLPFFDCAYHGLAEGINKDIKAIEIFLKDGHEMFVAYSCAKNFSLYCQRVGVLFIIGENTAIKLRVGSQVKRVIRSAYSNPPAHGAKIVTEILKHDDLKRLWLKDLEGMRNRIHEMRELLVQKLTQKRKDFEYLRGHQGMFSFIDLNKSQVRRLIDEFAVYILDNGRMSVPGLTTRNIDYVVNSILSCYA